VDHQTKTRMITDPLYTYHWTHFTSGNRFCDICTLVRSGFCR